MVSMIAFAWFAVLARLGLRLARRWEGGVRSGHRPAGPGCSRWVGRWVGWWQRGLRWGTERPVVGIGVRVGLDLRRRRAEARRQERLARDLPAAIDLLAVAVGAGWTPLLALGVVVRWAPRSVAAAFAPALDGFALGLPLGQAYALAAQRSPPIVPLTDQLVATAALGSPIVPALGRLAHEARLQQRRRAEARARTVPVRLLFPLVFLVLPAFVLVTIVPAVVTGWRGA